MTGGSRYFSRALLVIFISMMVVFGLLAYRTEVQQEQIKRNAYDQCVVANTNATRINKFLDAAVASVKSNDTFTQAEKDMRIKAFLAIKADLPICTEP